MNFTPQFRSDNTMIYGVLIENENASFSRFDIAGENYQLYMIRESNLQELITSVATPDQNLKFVSFVFSLLLGFSESSIQ